MRTLLIILILLNSIASADVISPGKLTKSHSALEGLTRCVKCHSIGEGISDGACLSCHEKLTVRIKNRQGLHSSVKGKCTSCHSDHKGVDYDIMQFDKEAFDHEKTGYALKDGHKIRCTKCHKEQKTYLGLSTACSSCHKDVHQKSLSDDCLKCHNYKNWKDVKFQHDKYSKYILTGKHKEAKCEGCHPVQSAEGTRTLKFKPIEHSRCNACHYDVHKGKLQDKTCDKCHVTDGWLKAIKGFDHNNPLSSNYKLEGKHRDAACESCHPKETIKVVSGGKETESRIRRLKPINYVACTDCHADIHKGQFKQRCEACHTVREKWEKHSFRHESSEYKGYKLEGKHQNVSCSGCHPEAELKFTEFGKQKKAVIGKFKPLEGGKCSDCHYDVHKGKLKEKTCKSCHDTRGWKELTFDHNNPLLADYKLDGRHAGTKCALCHKEENIYADFRGQKINKTVRALKPVNHEDCASCHYDLHRGQFKGRRCSSCHTIQRPWKEHLFKHDSPEYKGYKLEGMHKKVECKKCHQQSLIEFKEFDKKKEAAVGKFKPLEYKACVSCHKDVHKGKYDKPCEKCHTPDNWEPKEFLHDLLTFNLKGQHKKLNCRECHAEAVKYKTLNSDCIACHKDPHLNQFGSSCIDCHKQTTWIPLNFKHTGIGFRLSGAHRYTDCKDCHKNRDYRNTPSDCYACHYKEYLIAPAHVSSGYSTDCTECHRAETWTQVSYDHSAFTFKGAHASLKNECTLCHGPNQVPAGTTENDCYTCHSSDYQSASNHQARNYSQDCTACHSQTTWSGASFSHQSFRLRGIHTSLNCSECHTSGYPGQYDGVTDDNCFACHANDYYSEHSSESHDCTLCHNLYNWDN